MGYYQKKNPTFDLHATVSCLEFVVYDESRFLSACVCVHMCFWEVSAEMILIDGNTSADDHNDSVSGAQVICASTGRLGAGLYYWLVTQNVKSTIAKLQESERDGGRARASEPSLDHSFMASRISFPVFS